MRIDKSYGFLAFRSNKNIDEMLFLEREEGFLDVPKGHMNEGETGDEARSRELFEETGLRAKMIIPGFGITLEYSLGRDLGKVKKLSYLLLCEVDGKPRLSHEHRGIRWLSEGRVMRSDESFVGNGKQEILKGFKYLKRYKKMQEINSDYSRLPDMVDGWKLSRNFVPGNGNLMASLMLVGQAPGAEEDKLGKPFIGRSGRLLDRLIGLAGMERSDLYITSVVQFFPPGNRMPTQQEVDECMPFLRKQIAVVKPSIIVTLGALSSHSLASVDKIATNHGIPIMSEGIVYFPSLHPAAGVRFKKNVALLEGDFKSLGRLLSQRA